MKRRVWISIAVVLVFMLSCTLISFKNYTASLNRVTVAATAPNQLRRSVSVNGKLCVKGEFSFALVPKQA